MACAMGREAFFRKNGPWFITKLPSRSLGTNPSSYLNELFGLSGRSCIITGGGTGIGFALASGLARAGASVVLTGRRKNVLLESVENIRIHNPNVHPVACDVTDESQIKTLLAEAEILTGIPPTILVNNAGINVRQAEHELNQKHWDVSMNLMLVAPFNIARCLKPNFESQKYGRIINIASLQSFKAFPDSIPYAACKSGTLGLTRALAEAYSQYGVTCNAVAPGYVKTDLTKSVFDDKERAKMLAEATLIGRNSVPDDLVGAAVFLASPASSYITGQTIPVDGGFTALGMR